MSADALRRERDHWIATNAVVCGAVEILGEASIWYGAVVRGDEAPIHIGARTNIQDGCVVHADPGQPNWIGDDCTVGHRAVVHGSRIGNRCLIGMGSIVLQESEIGDECLIGAGALVPHGAKIPPRSVVVGVPGKVVRQVTDAEARSFVDSAKGYVRKASAHAGNLFVRQA
jgi:carbonic anhydrase/acetyltransferase-like protein (isoleucine patch superfamily)